MVIIIGCSSDHLDKIEVRLLVNYKISIIDTLKYINNDSFFIGDIRSVKVLKNRIYLSDNSTSNIKVFDKNMNYIKSIGRYGEGPGEFPKAPRLSANRDTLYAFINNKQKLFPINENGEFGETINIVSKSFLDPAVPVIIKGKILFSANSEGTFRKSNITNIYSALIWDLRNNTGIPISKYDGSVYAGNMDKLYYAQGGQADISEGFNQSFIIHQTASVELQQFNSDGKLLNIYKYRPSFYKTPPGISKNYDFKNNEDQFDKYGSIATYYRLIQFDQINKLIITNYFRFGKNIYNSKSHLDAEHFLFAINEKGECVFDEPIPGYLADVADGYIYIVTEESPEKFVMLKCKLEKKK